MTLTPYHKCFIIILVSTCIYVLMFLNASFIAFAVAVVVPRYLALMSLLLPSFLFSACFPDYCRQSTAP